MTWCDDMFEGGGTVATTSSWEPWWVAGGDGGGHGDGGGTTDGTGSTGPTDVTPELLEWLTDWWPLVLAVGYVLWRSR